MQRPWWRSRAGIATLCLLGLAGVLLLIDHAGHLFGTLPYLLIAACPLMHLLMHRGHRDGRDRDPGGPGRDGGKA